VRCRIKRSAAKAIRISPMEHLIDHYNIQVNKDRGGQGCRLFMSKTCRAFMSKTPKVSKPHSLKKLRFPCLGLARRGGVRSAYLSHHPLPSPFPLLVCSARISQPASGSASLCSLSALRQRLAFICFSDSNWLVMLSFPDSQPKGGAAKYCEAFSSDTACQQGA
jgi:hypothetical protein